MSEVSSPTEAALDLVAPDNTTRRVSLTTTPFLLGRGDVGNQLSIPDMRVSRQCAAIISDGGRYYIEDLGHRSGVYINGAKIDKQALEDGDVVTFGVPNSFRVMFRSVRSATVLEDDSASFQTLLARMDRADQTDTSSGGLGKLNLLLEATRLLHSQLPLEAVLEAMLDRAISITNADRGLLLEADASGTLKQLLARGSGSASLSAEAFSPSQTVIGMAIKQQTGVITEDSSQADKLLQDAQSIVSQQLRTVVAIPLYAMSRANTEESIARATVGRFLGVLYLDSRRPTAFTKLDRQILDAIAIESASILDNARLVKSERVRQRMDQELNIAKKIQQALLPQGVREFPYLTIGGMNLPCHAVGGDYYDILRIDNDRTAFLIADVSGKGLGAALVTTMLQGVISGVTMGADPAKVFQHINSFLCEHVEVSRHATLFFATLDCNGNLEYLNAGHPSPFLVRRGEVTELYTQGSLPLGLFEGAKYVATRSKMEPGDMLVLYSDGVTEAIGPNDELYGESRMKDVLAGQNDTPLDLLQSRIVESVDHYTGGASQDDDLTLVVACYTSITGKN